MDGQKRHVTFESWCERDHLIAFDFDPEIVGVAAQRYSLQFVDCAGSYREHVPDFFVRSVRGDGVVIDVRPDSLIESSDQEKFEMTASVCERLGWSIAVSASCRQYGSRTCGGSLAIGTDVS